MESSRPSPHIPNWYLIWSAFAFAAATWGMVQWQIHDDWRPMAWISVAWILGAYPAAALAALIDRLSKGRSGLLRPVSERTGKRLVFGSAKLLLAALVLPFVIGLVLLAFGVI